MRIVGGKHRGTRLAAPASQATRPTSERTREALFNILAHGVEDFELDDTRVLDLFAGTGALGLEAISRGARFCLFVDNAASARGLIRRNVETLGLAGCTKIWRRDATRLGDAGTMEPFDLVFADPPYRRALGEAALASAREGGWLVEGALAVLEEDAAVGIGEIDGFAPIDRRTYGDTQVVIWRAEPSV